MLEIYNKFSLLLVNNFTGLVHLLDCHEGGLFDSDVENSKSITWLCVVMSTLEFPNF